MAILRRLSDTAASVLRTKTVVFAGWKLLTRLVGSDGGYTPAGAGVIGFEEGTIDAVEALVAGCFAGAFDGVAGPVFLTDSRGAAVVVGANSEAAVRRGTMAPFGAPVGVSTRPGRRSACELQWLVIAELKMGTSIFGDAPVFGSARVVPGGAHPVDIVGTRRMAECHI